MLRNGNSGLKMGVSRAAHTQYHNMHTYGSTPPPPPEFTAFNSAVLTKIE